MDILGARKKASPKPPGLVVEGTMEKTKCVLNEEAFCFVPELLSI